MTQQRRHAIGKRMENKTIREISIIIDFSNNRLARNSFGGNGNAITVFSIELVQTMTNSIRFALRLVDSDVKISSHRPALILVSSLTAMNLNNYQNVERNRSS